MKVAICAEVENDNTYINEWIKYHKNIGFDNIILYNKNKEENIKNKIKKEIEDGFIIYENNQEELNSYNCCLEKYSTLYDWILFINVDEFLNVKNNIKIFLNQEKFNKFEQILIKVVYTFDNNKLKKDKDYFLKNLDEYQEELNFYEDTNVVVCLQTNKKHEKMFFKENYCGELYNTTCNVDGTQLLPCGILLRKYENCFVKKYNDNISNYCEKIKNNNINYISKKIKSFFNINKITEKKMKIVKNFFPWYSHNKKIKNIDIVLNYCPTMKYTLKSIIKNLPFINNIFIIVENEDGKYKKLYKEYKNIYFINKKSIVPDNIKNKDIGLFLHNIESLSEHFIYVYNYTLFNYVCFIEEFFLEEGLLCMTPINIKEIENKNDKIICLNNLMTILKKGIVTKEDIMYKKNNIGYMYSRTCCPMLKSDNKNCFNFLYNEILENNVNHLIYPIWSRLLYNTHDYIHTNFQILNKENAEIEIQDPIYKIINISSVFDEKIKSILDCIYEK